MSRTSAARKTETKDMGNVSLFDSLAAVSAVLDTMPIETKAPVSLTDAFIMIDPVLATFERQRLDAEQHYNRLSAAFGFDDAMVEAVATQRAAIEQAYTARLKALRRRREESDRANALLEQSELELQGSNNAKMELNHQRSIKLEEERLLKLTRELEQEKQRNNSNLWLWAIILGLFRPANTYNAPALKL